MYKNRKTQKMPVIHACPNVWLMVRVICPRLMDPIPSQSLRGKWDPKERREKKTPLTCALCSLFR